MTYRSWRIAAQIERLGREAALYKRESVGTNSFNNTEWGFEDDPDGDGEPETVFCFRTYPNRNTEVKSTSGDRHRDSPVFMFTHEEWAGVDADDRIGYPDPTGSETIYELQAPTVYETHVEIFGEVVVN